MKMPEPGARVIVEYQSPRVPDKMDSVVGTVFANRYPHMYLAIEVEGTKSIWNIPIDSLVGVKIL